MSPLMLLPIELRREECDSDVFSVRRPSIDVLRVSRSAFSKYPRFEPAKTQSSARTKATKEKSRGTNA